MDWKTCVDFPRYAISGDGQVFDSKTERVLPVQTTEDGYKAITLTDPDGKRKTLKIHRLIALSFIPNPENKPTVNHLDGVKENNIISNLEWATRSEQTQHAWDNGLIKDMASRKSGIRLWQGKRVLCVTTGEVFSSLGEACEKYGLKKSNLSAVCLKKKGYKTCGQMKWEYVDA